jgi:hypothetical protein
VITEIPRKAVGGLLLIPSLELAVKRKELVGLLRLQHVEGKQHDVVVVPAAGGDERPAQRVRCELACTQKFSEKGKAPPTLIEKESLGCFFMDGQLTVRSTEQWWLCRAPLAGRIDSEKAHSDLFCHLYRVERDALAEGVLLGHG